jgi:hypothetical protein
MRVFPRTNRTLQEGSSPKENPTNLTKRSHHVAGTGTLLVRFVFLEQITPTRNLTTALLLPQQTLTGVESSVEGESVKKEYKIELTVVVDDANRQSLIDVARRCLSPEGAFGIDDDEVEQPIPPEELIEGVEDALMELLYDHPAFEAAGVEVLKMSCTTGGGTDSASPLKIRSFSTSPRWSVGAISSVFKNSSSSARMRSRVTRVPLRQAVFGERQRCATTGNRPMARSQASIPLRRGPPERRLSRHAANDFTTAVSRHAGQHFSQ